jgi:uncharacterized integral membrane protein
MREIKIGLLMIVAVAAGVLVAQNTEVVDFNLLFWRVSLSRIVLLLLAMTIGFLAGFVCAMLWRGSRSQQDEAGQRKT